MKKLIGAWAVVATLTLGSATVVLADFKAGLKAYESGNYATALREWKLSAEQGNVSSQFKLGVMYDEGQGVTQDYVEAVKWYSKAAKQGDAKAQYSLGEMYDYMRGVALDYKEAVRLYSKAAKQGVADAQLNLGKKYHFGLGVAQNYNEAARWYSAAAGQGLAEAQYLLGTIYSKFEQYKEAVKWYRKAAEQVYASAQSKLGDIFDKGRDDKVKGQSVLSDKVAAYMWYKLVGANGSKNRARIKKEMTSSQVAEAQKLARECVEKNYKGCGS
jgi:uncharacterized protein